MNKKVLLVSNTSWYLYNFRRGTVVALREAGCQVICLAPEDGYSYRLVEELGVEYVPLSLNGKSISLFNEGLAFLRLLKVLHFSNPTFVFNFTVKANIYSGLACRLLGLPYANNISGLGTAFLHDSWLFRRVRSLYGLANRGARCVFFQNYEDHDLFVKKGLVHDIPTIVLPGSGMDTSRFAFSPLPSSPIFTFVMVARLLGDKGVREYVKAAELVSLVHSEVRFLLVGPLGASNRTAIQEAEVADWQAKGVIDYLGELSDVRPWLEQSHVLVLPSYREGMPRTVLEAASMGRPAIVTDVPGCRHAVVDGETGWLCRVKDASSLAQRMHECLEMPRKQLAEIGESARRRIEAEFAESIVVDAYLDCVAEELDMNTPISTVGRQ